MSMTDADEFVDDVVRERPEAVVLLTSRSFATGAYDGRAVLESAGLTVRPGSLIHDLNVLAPDIRAAVAWIAGTAPITARHLEQAPRLRIIARYGAGVDSVDLDAAAARGIVVTNTPDANADAVADLTLALMLSALRGIPAGDRRVRVGDWSVSRSRELGGSVVGVVGVGRIGRRVARRVAGFGAQLLGHDPGILDPDIRELGLEPATLDRIAAEADIVTLHAPGGGRVVDQDWLAHSKPGQIIVNAARASLVDEAAVASALRQGRLGAYASDTLATDRAGDISVLLDPALQEVTVFSPHAGAQTVEAVDRMGKGAVEAVLALLAGQTPSFVMNMSPDRVKELQNVHR
jgi:D-3-phosphoglycerate dehydrogenase / 2-oxoglutarate reductase